MTLDREEKRALSKYRLEKAERLLEDARLLHKDGRWESAVNRSYYAALNAAKAALILFGLDPKTHEGVKTMIGKKLVGEGLLGQEYGKWFRHLLAEREDADYADYVTIDEAAAEEAVRYATAFVEKMREVIRSLSEQL